MDKTYKWYVIYTKYNHERTVFKDFQNLDLNVFLPLIPSSGGLIKKKKTKLITMFPNYIFLNISNREYVKVLEHSSVHCFVIFEGKPVSIPDKQIQMLKEIVNDSLKWVQTTEYFPPGTKVLVDYGNLNNVEGEVVCYKGQKE